MMEATAVSEFNQALSDQSNGFGSAWSTAADKFTQAVATDGGAAVVTEHQQFELLPQKSRAGTQQSGRLQCQWLLSEGCSVKNERTLCFGVALGLSALSYGCGGYAHMNGQKVAEFIKEDLVRFGYCASSADCSQKKIDCL
jgi:hypothetical protein